jgi:hypothetical protein
VDPWDGRPLRYDAGPPARVWSVGRDGRDDGGAPPAKDADDAEAPDLAITLAAPP